MYDDHHLLKMDVKVISIHGKLSSLDLHSIIICTDLTHSLHSIMIVPSFWIHQYTLSQRSTNHRNLIPSPQVCNLSQFDTFLSLGLLQNIHFGCPLTSVYYSLLLLLRSEFYQMSNSFVPLAFINSSGGRMRLSWKLAVFENVNYSFIKLVKITSSFPIPSLSLWKIDFPPPAADAKVRDLIEVPSGLSSPHHIGM